ncbi:MAG: MarR family winged helix-turn-helix transcriptional regulator [Marmoricola sp.]
MTPGPDRDVAGIEHELTLLSRHFVHAAPRTELALDRSGYLLLGRLELEQPMTLRGLAEAFRLDQSTINRQVAALRREGLVERIADPEGGPAHVYRPTTEGLRRLRSDRARMQQGIDLVIGSWPGAERADLHRLLVKLNAGIEGLEGRPWPR